MTDHFGWTTPTIERRDGRAYIVAPEHLAGSEVVTVAASPCLSRPHQGSERNACGLVRGHYDECWECSLDLIVQSGTLAVVKS